MDYSSLLSVLIWNLENWKNECYRSSSSATGGLNENRWPGVKRAILIPGQSMNHPWNRSDQRCNFPGPFKAMNGMSWTLRTG